jgi:hypothetical protein
MKLDLEPNEVQFLLQVLGELPTKTGAFVLVQKIEVQFAREGQAQAQTNQPGSGE